MTPRLQRHRERLWCRKRVERNKALPRPITMPTRAAKCLFQKVRNPPGQVPRFWCRQPNGRGGSIKGLKEVDDRPLYRLPEVLAAIAAGREIAVVEGEKDADRLWSIDIPATCNFDGAADATKGPKVKPKWRPEYSDRLRGARLVVLNDNDPQGHAHADAVCRMSAGIAASVRRFDLVLHWPGNPEGRRRFRLSRCRRRQHARAAACIDPGGPGLRAGGAFGRGRRNRRPSTRLLRWRGWSRGPRPIPVRRLRRRYWKVSRRSRRTTVPRSKGYGRS